MDLANSYIDMGENKYLIEFQKEEDLQRVINGRPQSFDQWLVCLQKFDGCLSSNEVPFNKEVFWLQVHNILLACMTQEVGMMIDECVGKVVKVNADQWKLGWGKFLRLKVEVDITKGDSDEGTFLIVGGQQTWIQFKYERLSNFTLNVGVKAL